MVGDAARSEGLSAVDRGPGTQRQDHGLHVASVSSDVRAVLEIHRTDRNGESRQRRAFVFDNPMGADRECQDGVAKCVSRAVSGEFGDAIGTGARPDGWSAPIVRIRVSAYPRIRVSA